MSKEGFDNENEIIKAINGKRFVELNDNLQTFINDIFSFDQACDDILICKKEGGMNKSDIKIIFCGSNKTFSIKMGTGNSVHQENLEGFLLFLKNNYNLSSVVQDDIRFFVWGDGTLDGSGDIKNRLNVKEMQNKHPDKISRIQHFFNQHKRDLIKRFVITGVKSHSDAEYIYYGSAYKGFWASMGSVLDLLCNSKHRNRGALAIGKLTFQAWNRNINGGDKSENKRGVIQLKWGSVGEDIKKISEGL
jgi:hypothetical protein